MVDVSRHRFVRRFGGANMAVNAFIQSLHVRGATGITSASRVRNSARAWSVCHSRVLSTS